jgi:hypothetical protein
MTTTRQIASRFSKNVDEVLACAVCEHQLADHDATALRYCRATQAQALSRGCVCR